MEDKAIEELEAGRELDALVAEKVMGWQRVEEEFPYFWPTTEMMDAIKKQHPDVIAVGYFPCPNFSTDIAPSWSLFEWLAARGIVRVSNGDGDSLDVDFTPHSDNLLRCANVSADTLPRALCLATLEAVSNTMPTTIERLIKTEDLKLTKLLTTAGSGCSICMCYDETADTLILMISPPSVLTIVHYLDEHVALLYEPDSLEVVGCQVKAFQHSFLKERNANNN